MGENKPIYKKKDNKNKNIMITNSFTPINKWIFILFFILTTDFGIVFLIFIILEIVLEGISAYKDGIMSNISLKREIYEGIVFIGLLIRI